MSRLSESELKLIQVGKTLSSAIKEALDAAHDQYWCAAWNEGQYCCVDLLLNRVEDE